MFSISAPALELPEVSNGAQGRRKLRFHYSAPSPTPLELDMNDGGGAGGRPSEG